MNKLATYIKKNLLGIAVAFGVCSFIYEGLIEPNSELTLTKYIGLAIFAIAAHMRYKENLQFDAKKSQQIPDKGK